MDDRYLQGRDTPSGVRDVRRKARGPRPRARSACDDRHLDERCERRRPRFVGKDSGSDPRIATMMRGERKGVTLRSAYFATLTAKERGHSSLSTHGLRTPKLCRVSALNSADTAWMLISTALVLVMTPAVGFFYSGMVRRKNTLNTLMMSFASLGFVGLAWALVGYSLAFAPSVTGSHGSIGTLDYGLLRGVGVDAHGTIPHLLFMAFQATFAIITAALISAAIVERMRFGPYVAFIVLWSIIVYAPIAHWVWASDGWLAKLGTLDFAGGTVVHINAAAAAFVVALVVGPRKDFARQALLP